MTNPIQPVRGMNDVLPEEIGAWQHLERVARGVFEAYGYQEVRVPMVEYTELFKRSIGPDGRSVLFNLPELQE